jgi:hypothetical protein
MCARHEKERPVTATPAVSETVLVDLLTSSDADIRQRGRLVATGVLDRLKEWTDDERERGQSPVDIMRAVIAVVIGDSGLRLAEALREDVPPELVDRAISMYAEMTANVLQSAFDTHAEYRAEK